MAQGDSEVQARLAEAQRIIDSLSVDGLNRRQRRTVISEQSKLRSVLLQHMNSVCYKAENKEITLEGRSHAIEEWYELQGDHLDPRWRDKRIPRDVPEVDIRNDHNTWGIVDTGCNASLLTKASRQSMDALLRLRDCFVNVGTPHTFYDRRFRHEFDGLGGANCATSIRSRCFLLAQVGIRNMCKDKGENRS